jgi:diguanylate cyclase
MTYNPGKVSSLARLVRHNSLMRGLGFVTSACGVCAAMVEQQQAGIVLVVFWINIVVWPLLAWRLMEASPQPLRAEYRNLVIDTAMAGFWSAVIGFDVLPTVMLASMMMMDRMIAGGGGLAARAMGTFLLGAVLGWSVSGFPLHPRTSFNTLLWCLPFLTLYPLGIGTMAWLLAERVRKRKRELEQDSRIDPHTGLTTRKQWQSHVAMEVRRYQRYGTVASLMMIDIDHFKQINDQSGHLLGDQVIRQVAETLLASLRGADTAGRFGGDEFCVLLPGTAREAALDVAGRVSSLVQQRVRGAERPVTLSIGVAEIGPGRDDTESWIAAADEALYRAKAAGRACVRD